MKAKSLFLAIVASAFFWACTDGSGAAVAADTGNGTNEIGYSSESGNNPGPTPGPESNNSATSSDQSSPDAPSGTPVSRIGALSVVGNQVVGANGQPAQLRGMSMFWDIYKEGTKYYNADVVNWLTSDWKVSIVRAAMAFEENGTGDGDYQGYVNNPSWNQQMVETIVDAAIANGIYVIIDLHSHWVGADDHVSQWPQAKAFFEAMATKYGKYPNVIYEIYNEPGMGEDSWPKIKAYAETIIPAIRAIDPDNLIIVGTPSYSSHVDKVTALTGVTNVAYTFHFYASEPWHHNEYLPMVRTVAKQLPLFVTEWGLSEASGKGNLNMSWVNDFMTWMEGEKLSWAAWSICDKDESSAALVSGASSTGGWTDANLSQSGKYLRGKILELNQ